MSIELVKTARSKFPLGRVVLTDNAQARLGLAEILDSLHRHARCDWGNLPAEEARANCQALKHGGRLMSAYGAGISRLWIITESDRSATTILLPLDY